METDYEVYIRELINSGIAALYLYDAILQKHLWHNGRFNNLLGINNHELAENPVEFARKKYHPDDQKMICQRLEHFDHHDTWEGYYRIKHADGHFIWVFSKNQVLKRDESGKPIIIGGFMTTANGHPEIHQQLIILAKEEIHKLNNSQIMSLTTREREILRHIAAGESYTRIADLLNVAPGTVNRHRKNIQQKLGLHSIALLVYFAKEVGLL